MSNFPKFEIFPVQGDFDYFSNMTRYNFPWIWSKYSYSIWPKTPDIKLSSLFNVVKFFGFSEFFQNLFHNSLIIFGRLPQLSIELASFSYASCLKALYIEFTNLFNFVEISSIVFHESDWISYSRQLEISKIELNSFFNFVELGFFSLNLYHYIVIIS